MSEIQEYKCPACGGTMEFDSKLQKMKCPYCDTVLDMDQFEENVQEKEQPQSAASDKDFWGASGDAQWEAGEEENMKIYVCQSCGGEIIAEDSTGASTCPYCGNRVVMKAQFKGDLKPDYIIPFKLDKKDAKAAYLKHLKNKSFLPKLFKNENHIDEMKGVYVPFWLFDVEATADITYLGEKTKVRRRGDTEYTEHKYYEAVRSGSMGFERIPEDGSKKMDDTLMEAVEPYDFSGAVPFKSAYLAGYVADRYDVESRERIGRAKQRVQKSIEKEFQKSVKGYDSVTVRDSRLNVTDAKYWYALYPVWILNSTWKDNKYVFAMNGQTGKLVGDLPVDNGLFWKYIGIRGTIFSVLIFVILMLLDMV